MRARPFPRRAKYSFKDKGAAKRNYAARLQLAHLPTTAIPLRLLGPRHYLRFRS